MVHVGDLDGSSDHGILTWRAEVNAAVHDAAHAPVAGAKVTGKWSEGGTNTSSCTTGGNGRCTTKSGSISKLRGNVTFTVTGVVSTAGSYSAAPNHDPESDSNGTKIVIRR